jgi:signal transduction histidine kinase
MTWTQNEMNGAKDTEPAATLKPLHQKLGETASPDRLAGVQPVAVLGTADAALAQRLSRELERSVSRQVIALAGGLTPLRELLKTCSPSVIFLDTDLLGGLPLLDTVRPLAASVPVLVLASLNAQADIAKLVADERIDFVARAGDFVPLASAMIARRLNHPSKPISSTDAPQPGSSSMSEIFRHEINNPLTGILGNTELVLAHREHFSGVEVQRLQTVVDLAVRLRESIRRISNTWESNCPPKTS